MCGRSRSKRRERQRAIRRGHQNQPELQLNPAQRFVVASLELVRAYQEPIRGAFDAQIFTNDREKLPTALGHDVSKQTAHVLHTNVEQTLTQGQEISGPQQEHGTGLGITI